VRPIVPYPPVSAPAASGGFTLIEIVIALAILGILIGMGVPAFSSMLAKSKLNGLAEFYIDGLRLARTGAIQHSANSRFVLTGNSGNNQYDWKVDWCFPTSAAPCHSTSTNWSTTSTVATNDPQGAAGSKSISRSASSQPPSTVVATSLTPATSLSIYFNAFGWVDTAQSAQNPAPITQIRVDADSHFNPNTTTLDVRPAAISINLSGMAARCDPLLATGDSRACPP
jgi:type IV fimbrial biogenesis protein FimT